MFKSVKAALAPLIPSAPISFPPKDAWETGVLYSYGDLTFTLELLKGDTRSGQSPAGESWSVIMPAAYGYFPGIMGADTEDVDVYVASPFNSINGSIFIIDQIDPATQTFDEHKVMLGFDSKDLAKSTYEAVFSDGSGASRIGAMSYLSSQELLTWIFSGDHSGPYAWSPPAPLQAQPPSVVPPSEIIEIKLLADPSNAPVIHKVPMSEYNQLTTIYITSAFDADRWGSAADEIVRTLQTATQGDQVVIVIASPGGEVALACRIASAIETTKATVTTRAFGLVASAACLLWAEGHIREVAPASYFMQHMSSHMDGGKTTDIARRAAAMARYVRDVILAKAVSINLFTDDEVSDMIDKNQDIYLTGREVVSRTHAILLTAQERLA